MILEKLRPILAELFDVDESEITMDTHFIDDLYADSLDAMELLMIIEEEFDFKKLEKTEIVDCRTVGEVVSFIERSGHGE